MKYLSNCFLLILPALLFNVAFISSLPKAFSMDFFWKDIPPYVGYPENILRVFAFAIPIFFPLRFITPRQKGGLVLYLAGTIIYFVSWMLQLFFPESAWSTSWIGFMAPAYTPLIWFLGIGLIGATTYFRIPYKWWYYTVGVVLFLIFHNWHTWIIYSRAF